VCSKNEDANARAPFTELSTMSLTLEDIASFKANWDPKPDNIQAIAKELNIGLDSMVFVDDNPAERSLVEQTLPSVRVLHLSDDPADYPGMLDRTGWFHTPSISADDAARTRQYQENTEREHLREHHTDYDGYLRSLGQEAVIRPFEELHIDRITQLINKTNQFNLTTKRQTRSEIEERMRGDEYLTAYVRLADRFGDNGLISVWYGRCEGTRLVIEQWLMSCRVFNRGVEQFLMNYIAEAAGHLGLTEIHGTYVPTPKNTLVANLYQSFGFQRVDDATNGTTEWVLALDRYEPRHVFIDTVDEHRP
jgi:FkbH-like protein